VNLTAILAELDTEIARLQQARSLLAGETVKRGPGKPKATAASVPTKKKRNLSPEGRARIAAAVKARWAKAKKKGA
jgi:hypothetical protein